MGKEEFDDRYSGGGIAGNASFKQPSRQARQVDRPVDGIGIRPQPAPPRGPRPAD
jgi:hypothetical protein